MNKVNWRSSLVHTSPKIHYMPHTKEFMWYPLPAAVWIRRVDEGEVNLTVRLQDFLTIPEEHDGQHVWIYSPDFLLDPKHPCRYYEGFLKHINGQVWVVKELTARYEDYDREEFMEEQKWEIDDRRYDFEHPELVDRKLLSPWKYFDYLKGRGYHAV